MKRIFIDLVNSQRKINRVKNVGRGNPMFECGGKHFHPGIVLQNEVLATPLPSRWRRFNYLRGPSTCWPHWPRGSRKWSLGVPVG